MHLGARESEERGKGAILEHLCCCESLLNNEKVIPWTSLRGLLLTAQVLQMVVSPSQWTSSKNQERDSHWMTPAYSQHKESRECKRWHNHNKQ